MATNHEHSLSWVRPSSKMQIGLNPTQAPGCTPEQLAKIPTLTDKDAELLADWTTAPLDMQLRIEEVKREILEQKLENMRAMTYDRNVYHQKLSQKRRIQKSKEFIDEHT